MVFIVKGSGFLCDCKAIDLEGRQRVAEEHTSWSGLYEIVRRRAAGAERHLDGQTQDVTSHSKSLRYR